MPGFLMMAVRPLKTQALRRNPHSRPTDNLKTVFLSKFPCSLSKSTFFVFKALALQKLHSEAIVMINKLLIREKHKPRSKDQRCKRTRGTPERHSKQNVAHADHEHVSECRRKARITPAPGIHGKETVQRKGRVRKCLLAK